MDFDLSKAQKLLQQSARDFFARECKPERVRELMATETAFDEVLWQAMADQGFTGLTIPEEYGGLGLSLVDLIAVAEEMGRACLPGPFLSTLWAASLIERAGNEGQRKQYLEPISAGEVKATVALLEESADWNLDAVEMRAEKDGKEYRLRGAKHFVTDAAVADVIICVVRDGADLILLPVEQGAAGLTITATPAIDATRKLFTVEFDNVAVPESSALAFTTKTKEALEAATDVAIVALCAEMLGGMQWTLENTVEYAKTRQQFGKPIGIYQAVQHQCADIFNFTESVRSAVYYAAWAVAENDPSAKLAVSIAKGYASDAAREVGNRGVQIHGGIGFTWEHNIQLYYKRAKASEVLFGDANYHREAIARKVVDESEG
ncbi:MAG: acyl-CoA/acyl-ACP dehydrogenase [Acidobacteriota bacterium]|nr:acyl-CoA/acyl-ACP dehydrogenase [Acidobacteriota bacterium]